jgi:hypothetical protein
MRIFKEIRPVRAELFRADRQTDRHIEAISRLSQQGSLPRSQELVVCAHPEPINRGHAFPADFFRTRLSDILSLRLAKILHYLLHTRPISRKVTSHDVHFPKYESIDSLDSVATRLHD